MKKIMGLKDIVLMNVAAIIGLRWLPIAAGYGASAISLWIIAALLFFIPLGLVSTELATAWPEEGGLYVWTKQAYGERPAFIVSWFYWINSFFYLPSLLTFIAVTLSFLIKPTLATNKIFICSTVLIILWCTTLINIRGLNWVKWLANIGGTCGTLVPGAIIIIVGLVAVFIWHHPIPTDYSLIELVPHLNSASNIVFLSTLMFSMSGIEITPILAGETKDPQKTFPRALFISTILIVLFYIIGTVMITWIIAPEKIGAASGIMDAITLISKELGLPIIALISAGLIALGNLGGVSVWEVIPIKMFFESTKSGVLPKYFTYLNRHEMPSHAIFIQSMIMTIVILSTALLPSVNVLYETLVLMATITYFIPYLFMFMAFLKLRRTQPEKPRPYHIPGGKFLAYLITIVGFLSVLIGIILPCVAPPKDVATLHDLIIYRIEIIIGPILFLILGYWIYARYERRRKNVKN